MTTLVVSVLFIGLMTWCFSTMTPEQKMAKAKQKIATAKQQMIITYGTINSELICPHCQTKGEVHTQSVKLKKGVSGAKATGAILTGGLSLLATGLSRKEDTTQAHCENCNSTWFF